MREGWGLMVVLGAAILLKRRRAAVATCVTDGMTLVACGRRSVAGRATPTKSWIFPTNCAGIRVNHSNGRMHTFHDRTDGDRHRSAGRT